MRVELKCLGQEERGWADQNHGLMVHRADRMLLSAFSVDLSTILIGSFHFFFFFSSPFPSPPLPIALSLALSLSLPAFLLKC